MFYIQIFKEKSIRNGLAQICQRPQSHAHHIDVKRQPYQALFQNYVRHIFKNTTCFISIFPEILNGLRNVRGLSHARRRCRHRLF